MAILNLSRASQVTKTVTKGIQNQRNLVTVHSLMPTPGWKKNICKFKRSTTNAQRWSDLRKNASSWELSTLQKWPANAPGRGIGTVTTADISMLSLERNLVLSELTFHHFKEDFKTLKFKITENSVQINVYSAILRFVLTRFISSKKVRTYQLTLDGKTKAA